MNASPITIAFQALESAYIGESAEVARVIDAYKAAQAANKSQNTSLFDGLLSLAEVAEPDVILGTAAKIRAAVGASLRVAAGLPARKAKGEKGGPDWSTPSVYAGIIANCLDAKARSPQVFAKAYADIRNAKETCEDEHPCGLFANKGANDRLLKRIGEMRAAAVAHQLDSMSAVAPTTTAPTVEELQGMLANARAEVAGMRAAGDPDGSLTKARAEREEARAAARKAAEEARTARAESATLAQQVQDLQRMLAAATATGEAAAQAAAQAARATETA